MPKIKLRNHYQHYNSNFSSATSDLRQSRDNIEYLLIYKGTTVKNEHFSFDKLHDLKKIMTKEHIPG